MCMVLFHADPGLAICVSISFVVRVLDGFFVSMLLYNVLCTDACMMKVSKTSV